MNNSELAKAGLLSGTSKPTENRPSSESLIAGSQTNNLLTQILDQSARARLNNIGAVDPAKLVQIESLLIQMAQRGEIGGKLNEAGIKDILDQISQQQQSKGPKITYNRRKVFDSDEDDDDEW